MRLLISWLVRLIAALKGWFDPPYRTVVVEDLLPERLMRRTLYVVRDDGFLEQAALLCPCGCGRILHMNLLPDSRPCWSFMQHPDGSATLHPSVWRQKDCKSHFWFRQGRIYWCGDS